MERVSRGPLAYRAARKLVIMLEMIKFEHTLFALPFALIGALVAANGVPKSMVLLWILVAMVGARSAAMAFNRIVDLRYDRQNPRTAQRALVTGLVSVAEAWAFTIVAVGLLIVSAYKLNPLAFALSPIALAVVLGYSYTKRFTAWSHIVLGMALAIAPSGAWIAVRGHLDLAPVLLSASVALWTAGFDVIYSLQDTAFDRNVGLHSLPQRFGSGSALALARIMHLLMVAALAAFGVVAGMGAAYFIGGGIVAAFLVYEHTLVSPGDISRVNTAFFTVNGFVSVGLLAFVIVDIFAK